MMMGSQGTNDEYRFVTDKEYSCVAADLTTAARLIKVRVGRMLSSA